MSKWSNLPFDILSNIFSFLSPDSLARARSSCKNWHECAKSYPIITPTTTISSTQAWFLAFPIRRNQKPFCYAHNPLIHNWHELSLEFLAVPAIRPIAPIGGLILLRVTNSTTLKLILCNPFTRQFRYLPRLNISRTNPAVGVTILDSNQDSNYFPCFRVYVAGGMSEAVQGGAATYEQTSEMYNSRVDNWEIVGSMPVEFSVRLTVWTPNENVQIKEKLFWITSARAYSVVGFDIRKNSWIQLGVPMAERLEFAALVRRNGGLGLVGGTCDGGACIWEMIIGDGDEEKGTWCVADKVPDEMGQRLLSGKRNWESVKCVGNDGGAVFLYRELGSGMVVYRDVGNDDNGSRWEWFWVEGCVCVKGKQVQNCSIRGTLFHPNLSSSLIF